MENFENLSDELFKPVEKEELNSMKGGNAPAYEVTITAKSSDPTFQDSSSRD
ncbi:hypothetical protein [Mucilaginibacter lappiensis]|jgi:hypothetical protein|uniref:hypothetical protein n=1 Tax=Mucilaginibacter lappiensis TaxID=354630 RepID=UPI003D1BFA01